MPLKEARQTINKTHSKSDGKKCYGKNKCRENSYEWRMGVGWTFKKGDLRSLTEEMTFQEGGEEADDEASHVITRERKF